MCVCIHKHTGDGNKANEASRRGTEEDGKGRRAEMCVAGKTHIKHAGAKASVGP